MPSTTTVTLIHHGPHLLPGHPERARAILTRLLGDRGVALWLRERVVEVARQFVRCESGTTVEADHVFWVTQALPPQWVAGSGLAVTPAGFVRVGATLQSLSHPWVFAAGDVASLENASLPKSGVVAVRMARPLEANLRAYLKGARLRSYRPQRHFLGLIGTADGKAVASHRWLAGHTAWFWRWKHWIDRRFMRQFEHSKSAAWL